MRAREFVIEAQHSIRDQIIHAVDINGGSLDDYFVRFTKRDHLGFSDQQTFGLFPDVDDPDFDIDRITAQARGRRVLWFYPLKTYLSAREGTYAMDFPYVWLVKLKPNAWLQTVRSGDREVKPAPAGKERVGILRMSFTPAALFFKHGFDLIGKFYDYAGQHQRHGQVKRMAEDRENYNGLNILLQQDEDEVFVKASAGGRELGHVLFVQDGEYLMPQDLEVDERYRGQGIAAAMYDYVKSQGYKIRRSGQQTDAGAGFWAKHRAEQNVWEQGVAEALTNSGYKEIEFVCANPEFPEATDPKLQKQMYAGLQQIPGVIPLFQDQSDWSEGQYSLTAIYKDRAVRGAILKLAKQLGVKVDLEQPVSDDYVDRAIRGEHEGQQHMAEGSDNLNYIGNCTDDDVIEHIFGDATGFAQAVEEYGDEFVLDDLVVKYDPETDVHSFYYKKQGVAEGKHASQYLFQIPMLTWKPVSRSVWNTIQDEGLDQEQQAPNHSNWVMASLSITPEHAQALQALEDDALEYFNRFDIDLKSQYPGLTDLIDYDRGTVTIVKPMSVTENFADGRNPQHKGDSARHGIPKHATIAQLEKIRSSKTASPRKKQLAHWQINMRRGKAKR